MGNFKMDLEKNKDLNRRSSQAPPRIAVALLKIILPHNLKTFILGDMQEEFSDLLLKNHNRARYWYWKQGLIVGIYFLVRNSLMIKAALICLLSLSVTLFLSLVLTVAWMSNINTYVAPKVVEGLMHANIHYFLFDSYLLGYGFEVLSNKLDMKTFIHTPSLIWATLCIGILVRKSRRKHFPSKSFTSLSMILIFLPYLVGYVYINFLYTYHEPASIGPVLATMIFPILYLTIPLCLLGLSKSQLFYKENIK